MYSIISPHHKYTHRENIKLKSLNHRVLLRTSGYEGIIGYKIALVPVSLVPSPDFRSFSCYIAAWLTSSYGYSSSLSNSTFPELYFLHLYPLKTWLVLWFLTLVSINDATIIPISSLDTRTYLELFLFIIVSDSLAEESSSFLSLWPLSNTKCFMSNPHFGIFLRTSLSRKSGISWISVIQNYLWDKSTYSKCFRHFCHYGMKAATDNT